MHLKKLHSLTLKTFIPPFILTLFVSVFLFFLVQIVITYLDDFIGKGLSFIDLITLFFYAWLTIIPQCIPLAVLLGSIMCYGSLAENYELAAMKSSGLSLFQIIKPVFMFIIGLALFTFIFNNFILPVVNLKFSTLLYDIRQKKPSVNIKEGIFYNKLDNYSLRVGQKSKNKDTLKNIYIYDHSAKMGNVVQMYAKYGKITTTADSSALVLVLTNGNRYEELNLQENIGKKKKTLSQLNFKELQVNLEVEDLKMKRTDEGQFKHGGEMMNVWQLDSVADSTKRLMNKRFIELNRQSKDYFYNRISQKNREPDSIKAKNKNPIVEIDSFISKLTKEQKEKLIEGALNQVRSNASYIDGFLNNFKNDVAEYNSYLIEWHKKIVVCFACIVLFFVGAPLGAIIKKGGLGLPVVVAVLFFLLYFILTDAFYVLALDGTVPPWLGMWTPVFIFLPISIFLTYKAANDSALFDFSTYFGWVYKLKKKKI